MPTVLITGANRGLGLEFTKIYAENKWKVIACCRTPEKASVLKQIKSEFDSQIIIFKMDICNQKDIDDFCNKNQKRDSKKGFKKRIVKNDSKTNQKRRFKKGIQKKNSQKG